MEKCTIRDCWRQDWIFAEQGIAVFPFQSCMKDEECTKIYFQAISEAAWCRRACKAVENFTLCRVPRLRACGDDVINIAFLTGVLWNATAVSFPALLNARVQHGNYS